MAYTKPDQTLFQDNLEYGEFVVQLDSGEYVAVQALCSVEGNTGYTVVKARARVVNPDGSWYFDGAQQTITSSYSFTASPDYINACGGPSGLQRMMCLTVMGENAGWPDTQDETTMLHASIRTNLAASDHAGPANIGDIL